MAQLFIENFRKTVFGKVVVDDLDSFVDFEACPEEDLGLKDNEVFVRSRNT